MSTDKCDSTAIASLFPKEVITDEANPVLIEGKLYPEEEAFICNAVSKRRSEFIAGRLCARRALAKLAMTNFPVLMAKDRRPVWPPGIVGSISHADGYCGVAIAKRTEIESVGFDVELVGRIDEDCWKQICIQRELSWIQSLPLQCQQKYITLIFSAKECFFKCQYPVSQRWVDFCDVTISVNLDNGEFEAKCNVDADNFFTKGVNLQGKYLFHRSYVFTGMTIKDFNSLGVL